jgi:hypothetical protein
MNIAKADIIVNIVALDFSVTVEDIRTRTNTRQLSIARAMFLGLIQRTDGYVTRQVATYLSRSVSDINYLRRLHRNMFEVDKNYNERFERVLIAYKISQPDIVNIELLETKSHLEQQIKSRTLQLIRVVQALESRGIQCNY